MTYKLDTLEKVRECLDTFTYWVIVNKITPYNRNMIDLYKLELQILSEILEIASENIESSFIHFYYTKDSNLSFYLTEKENVFIENGLKLNNKKIKSILRDIKLEKVLED
jgi:hypothetical protein